MKTIKLFLLSTLSKLMFACSTEIDNGDNGSSSTNNNLKTGQVEMKGYPDNREMIFYVTAKRITINWGDGIIDERTPNGQAMKFSHEYINNNFQTIIISTENLTHFAIYDANIYHEVRFGDCPDLEEISCADFLSTPLTVLEIKKADALKRLYCTTVKLTELDLNGCTSLETLYCSGYYNKYSGGKLKKLTLDKCVNLKALDCSYNPLTEINLNRCTVLELLNCSSLINYTSTSVIPVKMSIERCTKLKELNYSNNPSSTEVNLNGCIVLEAIDCSQNNYTPEKLNELFESLPVVKNGRIRIANNPGTSTCNKSIAVNKGWYFEGGNNSGEGGSGYANLNITFPGGKTTY